MIHVVRHAHAGSRQRWDGDDTLRPLSPRGHEEAGILAAALAPRLSAILSSPYLRCVQTMLPIASAAGLEVETADWLAEGSSLERVLDEFATLAPGTAICSHGDVIGDLIGNLSGRGIPIEGRLRWPKGSIWHLDLDRGRVRGARFEHPAATIRSGGS